MKIGVFDSGVGGLILLKGIIKKLPQYDYVYLGDTKRVPYGGRSKETIYRFTKQAVEYLFKNDCKLVILACNTVSAVALRKLQQSWLPYNYPDRRILGVIVPTLEQIAQTKGLDNVGLIATKATVNSKAYTRQLKKLNPKKIVVQKITPKLVPLLEQGQLVEAKEELKKYVDSLTKRKIEALVLGCTHYILLKTVARSFLPKSVRVISQDELVPKSLAFYLRRHKEMESELDKHGRVKILFTRKTKVIEELVKKWFGQDARISLVK